MIMRSRMIRLLICGLIALSGVALAQANEVHLVAHLTGDQEIQDPPVVTQATGEATLTLSADRTQIAYELAVTGLTPENITAAHIHAGARGTNGPIIFALSTTSFPLTLAGTLTSANLTPAPEVGVNTFDDAIAKILEGNAYVNVHTIAYPSGEIRGQIGRVIRAKVRKAINPRSNGVIAVKIYSEDGFDATSIDHATIAVGPAGGLARDAHEADFDEDGLVDLMVHVRTQDTGIACGDTSLGVIATTSGGLRVEAASPIKTPGCHGKHNGHGYGHGH